MDQGKAITVNRYADKDSVVYECEQSLRRLHTDYIDLFQILLSAEVMNLINKEIGRLALAE